VSEPEVEIEAVCEVHQGSGRGVKVPGMSTDDERKLTAAMRLAETCGFRFMQVTPGAAWWGERDTAQWNDIVFLGGISGNCNAARSRQGLVVPGERLIAERVEGDALTVLHIVCEHWPL
jgi:hypothetical protein